VEDDFVVQLTAKTEVNVEKWAFLYKIITVCLSKW
jgi:hypothetical protein